jgi:hypothetical protein
MKELIPKDEQETVIMRYRGEKRCHIWTTDTTEITRLRRKGYNPIADPTAEPYRVFDLPVEAIPRYRSAETIQRLRGRAKRLEKRSTVVGFSRPEATIAAFSCHEPAHPYGHESKHEIRSTVQHCQDDSGGAR